MTNKGSLYYASDKAVFDALAQGKLSAHEVRNLFLSRGIVVSKDATRDENARYYSSIAHDYEDHTILATLLAKGQMKEKSSSVRLSGEVKSDISRDVLKDIENKSTEAGDQRQVEISNGNIILNVEYQEFDPTKSEFKQVVTKHARIELILNGGTPSIRFPSNDYVSNIVDEILDRVIEKSDGVDVSSIDLDESLSAEKKTEFFEHLIEGVSGYEVEDVTDIWVFNPLEKDEKKRSATFVTKASLKGGGLHGSKELANLKKEGFYIYKLAWKVMVEGKSNSDMYEFEAQFKDPESCSKFSYIVKGIYVNKDGLAGSYLSGRKKISSLDERKFLSLLENSAYNAKIEIMK